MGGGERSREKIEQVSGVVLHTTSASPVACVHSMGVACIYLSSIGEALSVSLLLRYHSGVS